jgi:hypothetical protein
MFVIPLAPEYFAPKGAGPLFLFRIYKHLTPEGVKSPL